MSAGKHRNVLPLFGIACKDIDHFLESRNIDLIDGLLDRHRHRSVIDVLAGKTEVDELLVLLKTKTVELLLEEIFYSLHIVVGHLLDVLDTLGFGWGKIAIDIAKTVENTAIDTGQLWQRKFTKCYEILDFHTNAILDEGKLGKVFAKDLRLGMITSIDRRDSRQWTE